MSRIGVNLLILIYIHGSLVNEFSMYYLAYIHYIELCLTK